MNGLGGRRGQGGFLAGCGRGGAILAPFRLRAAVGPASLPGGGRGVAVGAHVVKGDAPIRRVSFNLPACLLGRRIYIAALAARHLACRLLDARLRQLLHTLRGARQQGLRLVAAAGQLLHLRGLLLLQGKQVVTRRVEGVLLGPELGEGPRTVLLPRHLRKLRKNRLNLTVHALYLAFYPIELNAGLLVLGNGLLKARGGGLAAGLGLGKLGGDLLAREGAAGQRAARQGSGKGGEGAA